MKKCINDYNLNNKRVIIRVDFNVPMKDSRITDDNRIKGSLETIKYAMDNNAKVILLSHLGRIKTQDDLSRNDLKPISVRLEELLHHKVLFVDKTRGKEVEETIDNMHNGDVILLQNTRYEDLDGNKESSNNPELGIYWASLGDIFINDAFGTSHRAHASNVGIASHLPNGIGFLVKKELDNLEPILNNPENPFTVILGGSKVSDKINVIQNLASIADNILIGGGMAFTFLKACNLDVGKSILDEENIGFCKEMLSKYGSKIVLPLDTVTGLDVNEKTTVSIKDVNNISTNEIGLDIGPKTIDLFENYIEKSNTVFWNGPMGVFEIDKFSMGTKEILESLVNTKTVIIGGGDTASAAINLGYQNKFKHISTGGGASLEMLGGKQLPGIEIIDEK